MMNELLEEFMDQEKIHNFEGDSGLKNLEKIIAALGYDPHGFRFGSLIEVFLSDNSAACDALVDFIRTSDVKEWRDELEGNLDEPDFGDGMDDDDLSILEGNRWPE
jgi:hypothetical protein